MSRLLTDSADQERHYSLKRWERGAQRAAWARRAAERSTPPLPCPWRAVPEDPLVELPAHVLALFRGDLVVVRFLTLPGRPAAEQGPDTGVESAGIRVIRGGIPWERWSPLILTAWKNNAPVPEPFRLRRRLPPQWLDQALAAPVADQAAFLAALRTGGFLPALKVVTPEAVAAWLRWDEMRARLIDLEAGRRQDGRG
jgi:hypothetical protein